MTSSNNAGKRWTAADHALMLALHNTGQSHISIADRLGRSASAISSRLSHVADGSIPQTLQNTAEATRQPSTAGTRAAAARVARHAPPMAGRSPHVASSPSTTVATTSRAETPSRALAELQLSSTNSSPPTCDHGSPTHIHTALERYNTANPRARFEAHAIKGGHSKPCSGCAAKFEGREEYFIGQGAADVREKLCIRCMQKRLAAFLPSRPTVFSPAR
jgi:hypothetical protein